MVGQTSKVNLILEKNEVEFLEGLIEVSRLKLQLLEDIDKLAPTQHENEMLKKIGTKLDTAYVPRSR